MLKHSTQSVHLIKMKYCTQGFVGQVMAVMAATVVAILWY